MDFTVGISAGTLKIKKHFLAIRDEFQAGFDSCSGNGSTQQKSVIGIVFSYEE